MNTPLKNIRWLMVGGATLAIFASSFLTLTGITAVFAVHLAWQVQGSPDQTAINHFAANASRTMMPWLQCLFTLFAAILVARRTGPAAMLNSVLTSIAAGLLGAAVAFAFAGRVNLHMAGWALVTAGTGWLGAIVGRRTGNLP
jgi:hypothetical protein